MAECYNWTDYFNYANFAEGQCSFFGGQPIISEAVGWIVVVVSVLLSCRSNTRVTPPRVRSLFALALLLF